MERPKTVQVWEDTPSTPSANSGSIRSSDIAYFEVPTRAYELIQERTAKATAERIKAKLRVRCPDENMVLSIGAICDFIDFVERLP